MKKKREYELEEPRYKPIQERILSLLKYNGFGIFQDFQELLPNVETAVIKYALMLLKQKGYIQEGYKLA